MEKIMLKAGKEKSLRNRHPWIFSGAIQHAPKASGTFEVRDAKNQFLALAYYNPQSSLAGRVVSWKSGKTWDKASLHLRLTSALERRKGLLGPTQTAARIVASEADLLPGLIVDLYGSALVFQILTKGMEDMRSILIELFEEIFAPEILVERSDEAIRKKEGLEERKEVIRGVVPEGGVEIIEHGMKLLVDIWDGHKTGFYLDQRTNRHLVKSYAKGKRVLNCFSYTGGFSLAALMGGATNVVSVDESRPALNIAEENIKRNGLDSNSHTSVQADVFKYLRQLREAGETYDLIIMDPPKFVSDRKHIDRACRGYKDLNLIALQLLSENGILVSFSCSGLLSRELFQKVLFGAGVDAQCEIQVLEHLSQSDDHPVLLTFPESLYLKGFICRKITTL
ncbi:MAG: class I SAM-dependent methyltransferase [Chitinophagaceae bacterium]|nr:class I SAM-dependent methyltransferase [Oligoflexus sp.]